MSNEGLLNDSPMILRCYQDREDHLLPRIVEIVHSDPGRQQVYNRTQIH